MTKDRIQELRSEMAKEPRQQSKYKFWSKEEKIEEGEDDRLMLTNVVVHPIIKSGKKEEEKLKEIFASVEKINYDINFIKEETSKLKNYQILVQQSTRTDSGIKSKLEDLTSTIRVTIIRVSTQLQDLEKKREPTYSSINRVVETQLTLLKKTFFESVDDYQQNLVLHKKIIEDIIKKQLQIVVQTVKRRVPCVPADREVTDEELSAILEKEDVAVFVDNFMRDTLEAKLHLQDAQDRHKELLEVEKSIKEINELFCDVAMHVSRQAPLIDRIESHVYNGVENTTEGTKKLSKARKIAQKVKKKKIILYLVIALLLIIVIILVICL